MSASANAAVDATPRRSNAPAAFALVRLVRMFYSPATATSGLQAREVLFAGLTVIALYTAVAALALPYAFRVLSGGRAPDVLAGSAMVGILGIQALINGGMLTLKWLVFGYALWAFGTPQGQRTPFRAALGVVVLAEAPRVLEEFFKLALVTLRGQHISTIADLSPPIGLNLLFSGLPPSVDALLNQFNLFEVWYVVVLAIGMRAALRTPPRVSAVLAAALWTFSLVIQSAFGYAARVRLP